MSNNTQPTANHQAVARAKRLVAALAEDNDALAQHLLAEAIAEGQIVSLAIACAHGHLTIAREFYDTDCEHILAREAMLAMDAAQAADSDNQGGQP
jgi:hypothetical protein